jgi:hypothetical protein
MNRLELAYGEDHRFTLERQDPWTVGEIALKVDRLN